MPVVSRSHDRDTRSTAGLQKLVGGLRSCLAARSGDRPTTRWETFRRTRVQGRETRAQPVITRTDHARMHSTQELLCLLLTLDGAQAESSVQQRIDDGLVGWPAVK